MNHMNFPPLNSKALSPIFTGTQTHIYRATSILSERPPYRMPLSHSFHPPTAANSNTLYLPRGTINSRRREQTLNGGGYYVLLTFPSQPA